jgi:hypothetical protein
MAALQFYVDIPSTSLGTTATVVAWATAPSNQRVKVLGYGFFFDGTSNSNQPVQIQLCSPTTGTYTANTNAVLNEPELTETIQTSYGVAASTQPTISASNTYKTFTVHPQLGYEYLAPLGQEKIIKGGTTWAASITAPNGVDVRGYVLLEE